MVQFSVQGGLVSRHIAPKRAGEVADTLARTKANQTNFLRVESSAKNCEDGGVWPGIMRLVDTQRNEQEEDLSRRCELLARELRLSLGVDEWRKTPGQKHRERLLLQELLSAVNERDRLVQEMDEQERAIADDDAIERNLSQVEIQRKNNCILQ